MKRIWSGLLGLCLLIPGAAMAGGLSERALVGGAIGGAVGSYLGAEFGGRDGAMVGGAIGGLTGAGIATQGHRKRTVHRHYHTAPSKKRHYTPPRRHYHYQPPRRHHHYKPPRHHGPRHGGGRQHQRSQTHYHYHYHHQQRRGPSHCPPGLRRQGRC